MSEIVWTPSQARIDETAYACFARDLGFDPSDYAGLHAWSVADLGRFWSHLWDVAGVIGDKGDVAFAPDSAHWMTGARFFPEARINFAENMMRLDGDAIAVIETDEAGHRREVTAATLRAEVARVAQGLRDAGVTEGDRVATVLPNRLESLVTMLATSAVGAVWTSCSPDFGTAAILDRIGQVEPKVFFAGTQVLYGGKTLDLTGRMSEIATQLAHLTTVVQVGDGALSANVPVVGYGDFGAAADLTFTRVPFDAPAFVLYTSGTTGKPKAIVHRTGGPTLNLMKEHLLHSDMRKGDRFMWYTNTAWMMYHWLVGAMSCGTTIVLYDGAPVLKAGDGLDGSPLWKVVERENLTHLGISPKYLATLSSAGFVPNANYDTSSLRWMLAAGSPMAPWQYDWMYDNVQAKGGDMGFASISGGTELLGCFLIGCPALPLRKGTLTAKGLGMAVQVLDDRGVGVIGRDGELTCTEPFPSMPRTFWGEGGDQRYHDAYFADRAEIWTHGDRATLNPDGSAVIHGRSDFTLNPGGVRIGTADIYNVCDGFAELDDCVVFGRPLADDPTDEEIVLCLKMAEGQAATADLAKSIRTALRTACSPRHVPAAIYVVADVPYTINGKRVEGAAKAMATGGEVKNQASLANAGCLQEYATLGQKAAL
ncbi:acetoacetate--CoA ligase [Marivivens marinus]|uniref:acetoacetate--CoA ligase n=1 Tax=Marivivens marinus TaxID=3110173 RepID=UPI003B8485E8